MSDESVSDDEVQNSRERVQRLREELSKTNDNLAESEASRNNAVRKERLDREAETLEQQLEAARSRLRVSQEESPEEVLTGPEGAAQPVTYPVQTSEGSSWYELSDGSTVQGYEQAIEAQHELDNPEGDK